MIVGVDPGKTTYLALLDESACPTNFLDFSIDIPARLGTVWDKWDLDKNNCQVVIENVHGMPYQDLTSQTTLVGSKYFMIAWAEALEIPYTLVSPSKWKRELSLTSNKVDSVKRACAWWPNWTDLFKKGDGHNYAEAALIGAYYLHMEA